ncbi:MAG: NADH-quinone oxidoreductase subunit J [Elusimicrobia bacterium]|nr:NADH-quinone oxidoreductase subunit J [Elusimicrobiota bacterium]MDE2424755.1 NADH-quinone oxidoreductase subunit J [Elusimicrobiota bacterium]
MGFWALCAASGAAVVFAGLMLLQRSLYAAALCLLVVLLQVSAIFFLAGAPLLAFLQIMIYAGAVMVLVVVTIMAAPAAARRRFAALEAPWPLAAVGLLLPAAELAVFFKRQGLPAGSLGAGAGLQSSIGPILFGPYAAATEAVTLLLLLSCLALIGRVRERRKDER